MHDALFKNIWIHNSGRALSIQARDEGNIYNIEYNNITIDGTAYQPTSWWGAGEGIWLTAIERNEGEGVGRVWGVRYVGVKGRVENGGLISSRGGAVENVSLCGVVLEVSDWHPTFERYFLFFGLFFRLCSWSLIVFFFFFFLSELIICPLSMIIAQQMSFLMQEWNAIQMASTLKVSIFFFSPFFPIPLSHFPPFLFLYM